MKTGTSVLLIAILFCALGSHAQAVQKRGGNNRIERGQNPNVQRGQRRALGQAQRNDGPGQQARRQQPNGTDPVDVEAIFERLDRNDDGRLTRNEVPRELRQQLSTMDTNGDGGCDLAEFEAARGREMNQLRNRRGGQGRSSQIFAQFDANADGLISPDEIPPNAARQFAGLDANGDGVCDRSEMEAAVQGQDETRQRGQGQRGQGQRGQGQRGQGQRGQGQADSQGGGGSNGRVGRGSREFGNTAQIRGGSRAQAGGRGARGGGGRGRR